MSLSKPGTIPEGHEGFSFANALDGCLACGIILADADGRITSATPEAEQILGVSAGGLEQVLVENLPVPFPEMVQEALRSGQALTPRQIEFSPPGGAPITVRVSALLLQQGRKPAGVALALNDLTAARQLEAHLQQLDRLANAGTLAATMAHEIKNALVAGKTFVGLLLEKNLETELAGIVRRELGRIDAIVSRMLKFAAPGREVFKAVHLHEVLDHSLRLVQPQMETQAISLNRSLAAEPDVINGDECELEQALVNLLFNALEAMESHGTLTVATETVAGVEGRQIRVTVEDTGKGIAPENLDRLFEPFFTTKPTGTGLGLAITRRIIHEHRGAITAQSQAGQGTAFNILLPAWPDPTPSAS